MIRRVALFFAIVFCAAGRPAFPDPPVSKAEIAKRAKASTAFVEVKPGSLSGFCVHSSGLFVTNNHVVSQFGGGRDVTPV